MAQRRKGELILLLGGARSGKSDYAERLAGRVSRQVIYLATSEAGDAEMAERVAAHQARRPAHWRTVEAPRDVAAAIGPHLAGADVVLLDCLTLLTSNVLIAEEASGRAEAALVAEMDASVDACVAAGVTLIVVSNEVGQGVVPAYELGRQYRDILGLQNQRLAARADVVLFFIAGLPIDLKALSLQGLAGLGLLDDEEDPPDGDPHTDPH